MLHIVACYLQQNKNLTVQLDLPIAANYCQENKATTMHFSPAYVFKLVLSTDHKM